MQQLHTFTTKSVAHSELQDTNTAKPSSKKFHFANTSSYPRDQFAGAQAGIQPKFGNRWTHMAETFLIGWKKSGKTFADKYFHDRKGFAALFNPALQTMHAMTTKITNYDFAHFVQLGSMNIAEPSSGAMLWYLFPATIGARLAQAYHRAPIVNKEGDVEIRDYREMSDVLRRDITSIMIFVFGLPIISKYGLQQMEKFSQIKLLRDGSPMTFQQLTTNYYLDNDQRLGTLLKNKNTRDGVYRAVDSMTVSGHYFTPEATEILTKEREVFKKMIDQGRQFGGLLDDALEVSKRPVVSEDAIVQLLNKVFAHDQALGGQLQQAIAQSVDPAAKATVLAQKLEGHVDEISKTAMGHLTENMNKHLTPLREAALQKWGMFKPLAKLVFNLEDYRGFVGRYGQLMKLPIEMVAFGIIVFLLGYGPVAFNDFWNQFTFARQKARIYGGHEDARPPLPPHTHDIGIRPLSLPFHGPIGVSNFMEDNNPAAGNLNASAPNRQNTTTKPGAKTGTQNTAPSRTNTPFTFKPSQNNSNTANWSGFSGLQPAYATAWNTTGQRLNAQQ